MVTGKVFPAKAFNYIIEIAGLPPLVAQTVQRPTKEIEKVEHGAGNTRKNTAGQAVVTDNLVIGMLVNSTGSSMWADTWFNEVQDTKTGFGGLPVNYERDIVIKQLGANGIAVETYLYTGCFIVKIEHSEFNNTSSDNSIKTIEISVDDVERIF